MNPIDIIAEALSTDEEILNFCNEYKIAGKGEHIYK